MSLAPLRLWGPDADVVILTPSGVPTKSSLLGFGGCNASPPPRLSLCQVSQGHQQSGSRRDSDTEARVCGAKTWPWPRRGAVVRGSRVLDPRGSSFSLSCRSLNSSWRAKHCPLKLQSQLGHHPPFLIQNRGGCVDRERKPRGRHGLLPTPWLRRGN